MTVPEENIQTQNTQPSTPPESKELNFRKQEEYFTRKLEEERQKRLELEQRLKKQAPVEEEEDSDDEPYVDRKRLKRELDKSKQESQTEIQRAVGQALAKERQQTWLKANPDFYEVMQHANKLAEKDPDWAEDFLELPDSFERQKLAYRSIKALGFHKKEEPKKSIQDEVNGNKKSLYYNPGGVGSAPYASQGNFSDSGKKDAYAKMQELKNRLRLG